MTDDCPECGEPLVQRGNYYCLECCWSPGAVKIACECGCGKMIYTSLIEYNHPEDYRYDERG